jgi:hypothetical protein
VTWVRLLPALTSARKLHLPGDRIGVAGARALAAASWPRLERLDLDGRTGSSSPPECSLGDDGARAIARGAFPALRSLAIGGGGRVMSGGIEALLTSPLLPQLEELSLTDMLLQPAHIQRIVTSPALARLRVLRLRQTYLTSDAIRVFHFSEATWRQTITELDLSANSAATDQSWPLREAFGGALRTDRPVGEIYVYGRDT